jgi:outer membrane protein OmpA-like peptidoglycan-associated protein
VHLGGVRKENAASGTRATEQLRRQSHPKQHGFEKATEFLRKASLFESYPSGAQNQEVVVAVSQYLRPENLIDSVRNHFTPDVVRKASSLVGESPFSTRSALNAAVPSVLSGLVNMASTREGANRLSDLARNDEYSSAAEDVFSLFGGGSATSSSLSSGQQLLGKIFGNKSSLVADSLARSSGVSSVSATKLLSLTAPLTLGVLGKTSQHEADPSSIANLLLNQKSEIAAAAPAGLSQILDSGPTLVPKDSGPTAVRTEVASERDSDAPVSIKRFTESEPVESVFREEERAGRGGLGWLPLLLIGLALAGLLFYLRGRASREQDAVAEGVRQTSEALTSMDLPGGRTVSVPRGSINYNLATFLADPNPGQLPKTFVFDHLNFESASTQLTPQSLATVNNLAVILKAYPNARIELAGHTDNTGTPQANQALSLDRANAVKESLVNQGVNANTISTTGYGQTRPVASNDNEAGRQANRRLELNVLGK